MKINIIYIITVLSVLLLLPMAVKGVPGNPSPQTISTELKDEARPFELSPERGRYALLTSVADYGSLNFPLEIAEYVIPDLGYHDGKFVSLFPAGVSFMALPLYIMGKTIGLGQVFAFLLSSLLAFINFILIVKISQKLGGNLYAGIVAGIAFLFATTAFAYSGTLYQHHATTFFIMSALLLAISRITKFSGFVMGVLAGLSFFVEYNNALFMLPALIAIILRHIDIKISNNKLLLNLNNYLFLGIIGFIIALSPSLFYSYKAYGDPFKLAGTVQGVQKIIKNTDTGEISVPQEMEGAKSALGFFSIYKLPQSMSVLVASPDRGIIWFSPVILLSLLGIRSLYKKYKFDSLLLLASAGVVFMLYGMWGDPWGGWAFGTRYLIPMFAVMSVFLAEAINIFNKKFWFRILFVSVFYYSLFVNLSGGLTTSQVPTSREIELDRYPKPTFIYNYGLIERGKSSSYVYNTYFKNKLSLDNFFIIYFVIISALMAASLYKSQFAKREVKNAD